MAVSYKDYDDFLVVDGVEDNYDNLDNNGVFAIIILF